MDLEKALQDDPGEEHRGFRMRCKATAKLKQDLVLYAADAVPVTPEAEALFGKVVRIREESWADSEAQARAEWFSRTRRILDELYRKHRSAPPA